MISLKTKNKLEAFVAKVRAEIKPEQFAYNSFIKDFDYVNKCGSVCCLLGWMPMLAPEAKIVWTEHGTLSTIPTEQDDYCPTPVSFKAAEYFGLTNREVSHLFFASPLYKEDFCCGDYTGWEEIAANTLLPSISALSGLNEVLANIERFVAFAYQPVQEHELALT